jgi:hypothetical protein
VIRGGLRARLVLDSVRFGVLSTLQQVGWFDPTVYDDPPGARTHQPFRYIARPVDWADDIHPNAVSVTGEDLSDEPRGFGTEVQDNTEIYIDVFAQSDAVGWQVAYDIRDSLLGKTVGAAGPQIDVYDFRQATPAPFATVDVEVVEVDRSQGQARQWQRQWFMVHLVISDEYIDEDLRITTRARSARRSAPTSWTATDRAIWGRIQEAEQHVP